MNEKSFTGSVFSFLFAFAGFVSHSIAILSGKDLAILILAFVYVSPLLIDTIEDYCNMSALSFVQYKLDQISVIVGSIYLLLVLTLFAVQTGIENFQLVGWVEWIVKGILVILPAIFVMRTLFVVRLKWTQNQNVAEAYYPKESLE